MKKQICLLLIVLNSCFFSATAQEDTLFSYSRSLYKLSVQDIRSSTSLASGIKESVLETPASTVIITAEDIRQRGYLGIDEIISDLPGFDIINSSGGFGQINAYQRGYRTPYTQRTLIMVNGKVDNHMWTHGAYLSKQYPIKAIDRVEVLYGPASAVYGANAFLGIINIVTKKHQKLERNRLEASVHGGSFNTQGADVHLRGKVGQVSYSSGFRFFYSDEEDLSGRWGYLSNRWYGNRNVWGPLLDITSKRGRKLGTYYNPTSNWGSVNKFNYKNWELGIINWNTTDGFGAQFNADKGQNNSGWSSNSNQYYLEHTQKAQNLTVRSLLLYKHQRIWGDWAEAVADGTNPQYSFVSYTQWNTFNDSWLFTSDWNYSPRKNLQLLTGVKYQLKHLTKSYDVPGYWEGVFSSIAFDNEGPYGAGAGIAYSTDSAYYRPPAPVRVTPNSNRIVTHDVGGYLLGIYDLGKLRFNTGIRFDYNSVYGKVVNPRISVIYRPVSNLALKLNYGEAFQEPAPMLLWGGWSGRLANPDLKPEKVRSLEAGITHKVAGLLQELSLYHAHYQNVIKEEAENAGDRKVIGLEYKLTYVLPNFLGFCKGLKGYLYYTFSDVMSSIRFDHDSQQWQNGHTPLGDIANHKLNLGIHLMLTERLGLNLRSNMVGERSLYTRNALNARGHTLAPHAIFNTNVSYNIDRVTLSVKVNNMFNHHFLQPGVHAADSGDNFSQRSNGFYNSLIPNPGRFFLAEVSIKL
ncbi:TonB-dependent receptor [Microscilla marina]|uniref:TonB-dependent receptor, putative n=1 Tax=Microscilla marina ATCC 23134 TaxID=313606 RepID=A1ZI10_MICM2|nr:TonB-dependent receptor [Microscilla marina]EAY30167.1 TonB-dependent receptor, putative [Microscilla marina ATCC 23134]